MSPYEHHCAVIINHFVSNLYNQVIFPYQYPVSVVTSPASACFLAFPSAASGGLGGSGQKRDGKQTNKQFTTGNQEPFNYNRLLVSTQLCSRPKPLRYSPICLSFCTLQLCPPF